MTQPSTSAAFSQAPLVKTNIYEHQYDIEICLKAPPKREMMIRSAIVTAFPGHRALKSIGFQMVLVAGKDLFVEAKLLMLAARARLA